MIVIGLHYAGVETQIRRRKRADRERLWDQIQVMERAAVEAMNRRRDG